MKKGDLVHLRYSKSRLKDENPSAKVGLVIEMQTRGPVPGAYIFWSTNSSTEWISIEKLIKVQE